MAELLGKCAHYWAAGFEDREDSEYRQITELIYRIELHVNPNEDDHSELVIRIREMERALGTGWSPETDGVFWDAHRAIATLSHKILKSEWERVKNEI